MCLLEKPDSRQGGENKINQITVGNVKRVMDTALVAEASELEIVVG